MGRGMIVLAAALAAVMVMAPAAVAVDTQCSSALTGPRENVVVQTGAICWLTNADVIGNVTARTGSKLEIRDSRIGGNVVGEKADVVRVDGASIVRGDVQITGSARALNPLSGEFYLLGVEIMGDVMVRDVSVPSNPGGLFQIKNNYVRGNLRVFDNQGTGLKSITGNSVGIRLQCLRTRRCSSAGRTRPLSPRGSASN
jgi:hypothetical protein